MPDLACQDFCTVADVLGASCGCDLNITDDGVLIAELIGDASDLMFVASGGKVHGVCTRTVWPISDGTCWAMSHADYRRGHPSMASWVVQDAIPLNGPYTAVQEVTIDGVVIAASDYGLYNGNKLFRRSAPWPTSNDITKGDWEVGTFTVTYRFGENPGVITRLAAVELVCQMIKDPAALSRLKGVTSANVQGVSVSMDATDEMGALAIPAVTRFLDRYAPRGMGALGVWTPELDNGWTLVSVGGPSGS